MITKKRIMWAGLALGVAAAAVWVTHAKAADLGKGSAPQSQLSFSQSKAVGA